jgi:hypothetical protein
VRAQRKGKVKQSQIPAPQTTSFLPLPYSTECHHVLVNQCEQQHLAPEHNVLCHISRLASGFNDGLSLSGLGREYKQSITELL